jgi:hypothetical protein
MMVFALRVQSDQEIPAFQAELRIDDACRMQNVADVKDCVGGFVGIGRASFGALWRKRAHSRQWR